MSCFTGFIIENCQYFFNFKNMYVYMDNIKKAIISTTINLYNKIFNQ